MLYRTLFYLTIIYGIENEFIVYFGRLEYKLTFEFINNIHLNPTL